LQQLSEKGDAFGVDSAARSTGDWREPRHHGSTCDSAVKLQWVSDDLRGTPGHEFQSSEGHFSLPLSGSDRVVGCYL
jgi:hypothetical protein